MLQNRVFAFGVLFLAGLFVMMHLNGTGFAQDDDIMNEINAEQSQVTASEGAVTGSDSEIAAPAQKVYLVWMIESLGWFFTPVFLVVSVVMVALSAMNFLAIRPVNFAPKGFLAQFSEYLDTKQFQEAYEYAKASDTMLGKMLAVGLAKLSSGYSEATEAMQAVGEKETMKHEHLLGYIALIGKISPMIGLFGTVVGMIASFNTIASSAGQPPVNKLAEGIATALFTTEVGLAIAIPALVIYDYLRNKLMRNLLDVSVSAEGLMSRFSGVSGK